MNKQIGRVISVVLVMFLCLSSMNLSWCTAYADETRDGYTKIYTADDLMAISSSGRYVLMNDIDLTSVGEWTPIGTYNVTNLLYTLKTPFTGYFDGQGHTINGLKIDYITAGTGSVSRYFGLFGKASGATIENLKLSNVNISVYTSSSERSPYSVTGLYVGAICGDAGNSTIRHCSTSGKVKINVSFDGNKSYSYTYEGYVGGLCGSSGNLERCSSSASVGTTLNYSGSQSDTYTVNSTAYTGGLIGYGGNITESFFSGSVYTTNVPVKNTGTNNVATSGLMGRGLGSSSVITNSYMSGSLSTSGRYGCPKNQIGLNCSIVNSYSANSVDESETFSDYDFDTVWVIRDDSGYTLPQLINNPIDPGYTIEEIEVSTYPDKISYYTTENIDVSGGYITVYYRNGLFETIPMRKGMVTDEPFSETGIQNVLVTYGEKTCTYQVNVSQMPNILSMELLSPPDRTEFVRGTAFDFTGCRAIVYFDNNTTKEIDVRAEDTTGGDINSLGTQTIRYTYKDHYVEFEVTVVGVRPIGIEISELPTKLEYIEGEALDLSGLVVKEVYNNGDKVTITDYSVSGFTGEIGTQTITVTYNDFTASFDVTVREKSLTSIAVTSAPLKTEYVQGQPLDTTGMVVTATYDNGTSEAVTDYTVGPMSTEVGIQQVEISYGGMSTYIIVKIIQKELLSISIESLPDKTTYAEDEDFKTDGLVVCANYNDDSSVPIDDYTLSGIDTSTIGEKEAIVFYNGKTATFTYTVIEKVLEYISVSEPEKTIYIEGEEFDPTGMIVTAYYNNGKYYEVEDYTVIGYTGTPGTNVITVTYGDQSFSFPVNVYTPASEWTLLLAPTCTEPGTKVLYDISGTVVLKVEAIDALGHTVVEDAGHAATCLEDGLTDGSHCSTCGLVFEEQEVIPATGHTPASEWTTVLEPTCTEDGTQVKYCVTCGQVVETQPKSAVGHRPVIDEEVPATCTSSGATSGTHCEVCGLVLTAPTVIPPLGHVWSSGTVTAQPTCTTPGTKTFTCLRCSEQKTETILALDHDFEEEWTIDKEPTCTEDGSKSHHCTRCDVVNDVTVIRHLGHSFTNYISNNDATCTEDGTKTAKCDRCEETSTITDVGSAMGHMAVTDPAVPAKCTETGLTEGSHCSVCGIVLVAQTIVPALGHSLNHVEAASATCETEGNVEYWSCGTCGHYYSNSDASTEITIADTVIPATGHVHITGTESKAPSCETVGNIAYWTCEDCGKIFSDAEATTVITLADTVIPATGHIHLTATEAVSPTCETAGNTAYWTCEDCGKIFSDAEATTVITLTDTVIPATGHVHLTATEAVSPTCETAGNTAYWTCEDCGKIFSDAGATTVITLADTVIPATGHVHLTATEAVSPTCETAGNTAYWTCEDCGKTFSDATATAVIALADTVIPATGHVHLTATEATSPTCESAGNIAYWICEDCRKLFSDAAATAVITLADTVIPATGHVHLTATEAHQATCSAAGNIAYWTCDACGKLFADAEGTTVITTEDTVIAIDPDAHAWGDWHVTVEPKCETEGEETRVCTYDNSHFETRPVPALGHDWDEGIVIKEPTYWEEGLMLYTCRHDPSHTYTEVIPMLEKPSENEIIRISGPNRSATAIKAAEHLKEKNGIEKFESIIIASGTGFPDALSASYLAYKKDGPILLVDNSSISTVSDYVNENLADNGTVYIVGGKGAVPLTVDENIIAVHGDGAILRLAGSNRYTTNILVLNEAGVDGEDMLVASGTGFADALSASAAKRPILLVGASLSSDQIKYLSDNAGKLTGKYYVIGGKGAVSLEIENVIGGYGTVKRVSGSNRYATSIAVADEFFPGNVSTVVIANGMNFPDGLSGGPIAAAYDAPLVLVVDKTYAHAVSLFKNKGSFRLIIMGGTGVIADATAEQIAYQ